MIKRTFYLDRICPFIGGDLIKVLTDIRRSGKSALLTQIIDELKDRGVRSDKISMRFKK